MLLQVTSICFGWPTIFVTVSELSRPAVLTLSGELLYMVCRGLPLPAMSRNYDIRYQNEPLEHRFNEVKQSFRTI